MAHVASSLLPDRPMELQRECEPCYSPNMLRFFHMKQHKTTALGELGIHTIRKACEAILVQDLGQFESIVARAVCIDKRNSKGVPAGPL